MKSKKRKRVISIKKITEQADKLGYDVRKRGSWCRPYKRGEVGPYLAPEPGYLTTVSRRKGEPTMDWFDPEKVASWIRGQWPMENKPETKPSKRAWYYHILEWIKRFGARTA